MRQLAAVDDVRRPLLAVIEPQLVTREWIWMPAGVAHGPRLPRRPPTRERLIAARRLANLGKFDRYVTRYLVIGDQPKRSKPRTARWTSARRRSNVVPTQRSSEPASASIVHRGRRAAAGPTL